MHISAAAICKVLWAGKFLEEEWHYLDQLMAEWQVMYCVVDADPQINEARRFARRFPGYVGLTRYRKGQAAKEVSVTEEDTGAPMLTVDRTNWLTASLGRFKFNPPRIQLPRDIPMDFREHCKNLVRTYERDEHGNPMAVFVETGADHFAHALTYAEIKHVMVRAQAAARCQPGCRPAHHIPGPCANRLHEGLHRCGSQSG